MNIGYLCAHSGVVPPVPIPNTVVKRTCADGTWLEGAWESRAVQRLFFLSLWLKKMSKDEGQKSKVKTNDLRP